MASKRSVRRRVAKALRKYVRGNPGWKRTGLGERSVKASKKRWLKRGHSREDVNRLVKQLRRKKHENPPKVKGRKVKGGRAVTVRNFTGTIVKKADGTVQIVGRGKKK